jgi:tetratricopeptide (TPR) repeat protein
MDWDRKISLALPQLGAVALAEGAYALARERYEESLDVWPEEPGHLSARACLGLAARGLGHRDEAGRHLLAELQWAVERRCFMPLPSTLSGIALLLADGGQAERAVELYALAARYPLVANSRWFEEVAGGEMATVAAQLPSQAAQAARARGQAADLWQAAAECLEILAAEFV